MSAMTRDHDHADHAETTDAQPEVIPVGNLARLPRVDALSEYKRGLVGIFAERAGEGGRLVAVYMLAGLSLDQAASRAGVTGRTVRNWAQNDPNLRSALIDLTALGAVPVEDELIRRAFAGSEDRGSMRALEMVAKARMPQYREKQQIELTVRHEAEQAQSALTDGWRDDNE